MDIALPVSTLKLLGFALPACARGSMAVEVPFCPSVVIA